MASKRPRIEHTEEFQELLPLCWRPEQIERRQPWQSYIETAFNVQRRMADWHFARAESWAELVAAMIEGRG